MRGSLRDPPNRCQWALIEDGREPVSGEGRLEDLPGRADRIQLVVPAEQVLLSRARVPREARRRAGSALAFAIEEQMAGDPGANLVTWLGSAGDEDVLAAIDKPGLTRWREALAAAGVHGYEVHSEALFLPWETGQWSLAWDGREGFVRTGELEGTATDCGDRESPPLGLRLLLEGAQQRSAGPASLALYITGPDATPDLDAWTRELGIATRVAGTWDWRSAPPSAGVSIAQEHRRWDSFTGVAGRLRPAAWILGAALAIHAVALVIDWTAMASEQQTLRKQMEARFRTAFPDALAVVDPALQMRRKLTEARHAAGQPDSGDFLAMIGKVSAALKDLPPGGLRTLSYEDGRMTLELAVSEEAALQRIVTRLAQSGLDVEAGAGSRREPGASAVITVRAA